MHDNIIQRTHLTYFDVGFPSHTPIPTEVKVRLPLMQTQYKIVAGNNASKVQAEVIMWLSEGWSLYGNLVISSEGNQYVYGQSLTKDEVMVDN